VAPVCDALRPHLPPHTAGGGAPGEAMRRMAIRPRAQVSISEKNALLRCLKASIAVLIASAL
jgi:hypothetical protein